MDRKKGSHITKTKKETTLLSTNKEKASNQKMKMKIGRMGKERMKTRSNVRFAKEKSMML